MDERTYAINKSTITLRFGDITQSTAEVIVSSDDGDISRGGGVSLAILRAAQGPSPGEIRKHTPAKVGDVVVTAAERLPARYILHAITLPSFRHHLGTIDVPTGAVVRQTVQKIMSLLPLLGCHSVAFPLIGTGVARISFEDAAEEMAEVIVRRLLDAADSYEVELYLYDRYRQRPADELVALFETRIKETLGVHAAQHEGRWILLPPTEGGKSDQGKSQSQEGRRKEIHEMLLHLGRRRDRLESDLLTALSQPPDSSHAPIASIRAQLEEIAGLRHIYEAELNPSTHPLMQVQPNTVFISSTYSDLVEYRQAVYGVVEGLAMRPVGMENFIPSAVQPGDYIRERVEESEVYLGVVGMRYGSIDPSSGLSMTELEYRQAVASGKPRLMFMMDQCASITVSMVEMDVGGFQKLLAFRNHVGQSHVCGMFCDLAQLKEKVKHALAEYRLKAAG